MTGNGGRRGHGEPPGRGEHDGHREPDEQGRDGHGNGGLHLAGADPRGLLTGDFRKTAAGTGRDRLSGRPEAPFGLDTLVRLQRRRPAADAAQRLPLPDDMTAPLGCDAVGVPDRLGPLIVPRLPRLGCVYADGTHWWWIVPADSDYALRWPSPARYAPGALVTGTARLIHRPQGTAPYTPPIPLYLSLCRVTGTSPDWSRAVSA